MNLELWKTSDPVQGMDSLLRQLAKFRPEEPLMARIRLADGTDHLVTEIKPLDALTMLYRAGALEEDSVRPIELLIFVRSEDIRSMEVIDPKWFDEGPEIKIGFKAS